MAQFFFEAVQPKCCMQHAAYRQEAPRHICQLNLKRILSHPPPCPHNIKIAETSQNETGTLLISILEPKLNLLAQLENYDRSSDDSITPTNTTQEADRHTTSIRV